MVRIYIYITRSLVVFISDVCYKNTFYTVNSYVSIIIIISIVYNGL